VYIRVQVLDISINFKEFFAKKTRLF